MGRSRLSAASSSMAWTEAMDGVPTPSRAPPNPSFSSTGRGDDAEVLKEKQRLEQELESDRLFFADPPDDFVRCPTCNIVYAVQASRPATPMDMEPVVAAIHGHGPATLHPMLPASYSKDLPRGSNLTLEEATRHMHRSRFRCSQCDTDFCRCGHAPYHWGWSCDGWQRHQQASAEACAVGTCRWCAKPCMSKMRRSESLASSCCGSDEGTDLKRYPPLLSCAEKERRACGKRLACGHYCGGVRGEGECPPCLHRECRNKVQASTAVAVLATGSYPSSSSSSTKALPDLPDGDDWCSICWTETLNAAPVVRLGCGHVMHHHCLEAMIRKGQQSGRRLTFKNIRCPLCQVLMDHPAIHALLEDQQSMYHKVRRKALQRWVVEQRKPAPCSSDALEEDKVAELAMNKMSFYECSQCNEPYYGGEVECAGVQEQEEQDLDDDVQAALAMELIAEAVRRRVNYNVQSMGQNFSVGNAVTVARGRRSTSALGRPTFATFVMTCGKLGWSSAASCRLVSRVLARIAAFSQANTRRHPGMVGMSMHWAARSVLRTQSAVSS
eukprot:CAMPEP_0197631282 /NCGR_PEP_ID=MMETSP1338-20131121/8496_1 /TAXON_ID=43686 ORGANISM="Pelagodinium beii, Strain RCC1491" /NCGR_SAMPLE_ID=MMETSP1338 /ASSEMBLY_ACC=CAM_ASM_000754 /LENGTH=553 /DNA_ID=CAMNT_0043202701 /DNA_START=133 /DNA_END=1795 /DNA_ORIENTATION=-